MFLRPRPAIRPCGEQLLRPRHCFCRPRTNWLLSDHMRTSRCLEWQQPSHRRYRSLCSGFLLELAALLFLVSFVWASIQYQEVRRKDEDKTADDAYPVCRQPGQMFFHLTCSDHGMDNATEAQLPLKSESREGEAKYRAGRKQPSTI